MGLRKVRAMPTDLEFWIKMSGFALAIVVFGVGWMRQRFLVSQELSADVLRDVVVPAPLSSPVTQGWWRISTVIYNRFDLILVAGIVGIYVSPLFIELVVGKQENPKMSLELVIGTVFMQFFIVAVVMGFVGLRQNLGRWLGLRWRMWPLVFPIAIVGWLFVMGVLGLFQMLGFFEWLQGLMGNDGTQEVVKAFTETEDSVLLGMLVFLAVVVAPVTEEIIFRGYLYPVTKRFIGRWPATIFGAMIFAVIHHNAQALIPLFILGVLLTLAYEFTGSIWAPIGFHAFFNGATVGAQLAVKYGWIDAPSV